MKKSNKTKLFFLSNNVLRSITVLLLFFYCGQKTMAQSIVHRMYFFSPGIIATAGIGPSVAFTDIKKNIVFPAKNPKSEWRLASQLSLQWEILPFISFKSQASYSYLAGTRPTTDRHFETRLVEGNIGFVFNPVMLFIPYRTDQKWKPSIIVGIGLLNYTTQLWTISTNELITTRGYGNGSGLWGYTIEGVALAGVSLHYKLDEHWSLQFETANRWMDSDKLDIQESIGSSPYDFYNITTFGVAYKFFKTRTYPPERPK